MNNFFSKGLYFTCFLILSEIPLGGCLQESLDDTGDWATLVPERSLAQSVSRRYGASAAAFVVGSPRTSICDSYARRRRFFTLVSPRGEEMKDSEISNWLARVFPVCPLFEHILIQAARFIRENSFSKDEVRSKAQAPRVPRSERTGMEQLTFFSRLEQVYVDEKAKRQPFIGIIDTIIKQIFSKRDLLKQRIAYLANTIEGCQELGHTLELILQPEDFFLDIVLSNPQFILGLILYMNFPSDTRDYYSEPFLSTVAPEICTHCNLFQKFLNPSYLHQVLSQLGPEECLLDVPIGFCEPTFVSGDRSSICVLKIQEPRGQPLLKFVRLICPDCYADEQKKEGGVTRIAYTVGDLLLFIFTCPGGDCGDW